MRVHEEALRALGLRPVRAEAVTSDVVAAGPVVAQDPPDGRRVPAGQIHGTARQRLKNLGLTVNGTFETSTRVPAGQVIRSRPGAGRRVAVGSTVTLTVSSGATAPRPRPSDGQSWSW
ncbi:PASTA domain-containing protein [Frankia sp. Mgl5]|uniref:PASTA domain-containing protein n=1 Tax=Frankia sp. Mgl5 TaxID=2933793 RepID=UPI0034D47D09